MEITPELLRKVEECIVKFIPTAIAVKAEKDEYGRISATVIVDLEMPYLIVSLLTGRQYWFTRLPSKKLQEKIKRNPFYVLVDDLHYSLHTYENAIETTIAKEMNLPREIFIIKVRPKNFNRLDWYNN